MLNKSDELIQETSGMPSRKPRTDIVTLGQTQPEKPKYQPTKVNHIGTVPAKKPQTLKENVAVLALGQAGGNIGKIFYENSFNTLFINTSKIDLETLNVSGLCKYHIKNGEGAAKDRKVAKSLLQNDFDNIMSNINFRIKEKIILVISSSAGGSGSGIAPYIMNELLKQNKLDLENGKTSEKLILCPVAVLPYNYECVQSKVNATQYFSELEAVKGIGTSFVIDNNISDDKFALNNAFYNSFLDFITIPDFFSTKSNFDESELKRLLSSKGTTIISSMDAKDKLDFSSIYVDIKENSIYPINNDNKIKFMSVSLPPNIENLTFESVFDGLKKEFGNPVSAFEDINNSDKVIITLSGLSFPYAILNSFNDEVQNMKEDVKNNFKREDKVKKLSLDFLDEDEEDDTDFNFFDDYFN